MTIEPRIIKAVFAKVERCLDANSMAAEVLHDYRQSVESGLMTCGRLRGFLQGLWAAGALEFEDYCEVDSMLSPADATADDGGLLPAISGLL